MLVVELLIFAVLVAFTPIQVGVEIDRRLFALPVAVAEPMGHLVTAWIGVSLLLGAATAFAGGLSARSGVRVLQGLVLLTCVLLQIYAGAWLFSSLLAATDRSTRVILGVLLAAAAGVVAVCAALWLRENSGTAGATTALAAVLVGTVLVLAPTETCTRFSFSSSAWKEAVRGSDWAPTTRQLLIERLMACEHLDGWSKTRVRRLLGEPTQRSTVERPGSSWSYYTGRKRAVISVSGYSEELYVKFGRRGTVLEAKVLGEY